MLSIRNIFKRNLPEVHFDADVRHVNLVDLKTEIRRLKATFKNISRNWNLNMSNPLFLKKNFIQSLAKWSQLLLPLFVSGVGKCLCLFWVHRRKMLHQQAVHEDLSAPTRRRRMKKVNPLPMFVAH
jgi:hypothetical protein